MRAWWLSLSMLVSLGAFAQSSDLQIYPAEGRELPQCRLVRTEAHFVLYLGEKEIQRYTRSFGPNMVDALTFHDQALLTATQTLANLRAQGACR